MWYTPVAEVIMCGAEILYIHGCSGPEIKVFEEIPRYFRQALLYAKSDGVVIDIEEIQMHHLFGRSGCNNLKDLHAAPFRNCGGWYWLKSTQWGFTKMTFRCWSNVLDTITHRYFGVCEQVFSYLHAWQNNLWIQYCGNPWHWWFWPTSEYSSASATSHISRRWVKALRSLTNQSYSFSQCTEVFTGRIESSHNSCDKCQVRVPCEKCMATASDRENQ